MIVRRDDLRPEGLQFDRRLEIGPLSYEGGFEIAVTETTLTAEVVPSRDGVRCRGRLKATASVPCSRCLEPYPLQVDRDFDVAYVEPPGGGTSEAPEHKITSTEFDVSYLDPQGNVNIDDMATEQIYLSIPMKPLCSEDCRGLCLSCGVNLNLERCGCGEAGQEHGGGRRAEAGPTSH